MSATTAAEQFAAWAELASNATEGPWKYLSKNAISTPPIAIDEANWGPEGHSGYRIHTAQDTGAWKRADVALMAASRTAVPVMAEALTAVLALHERVEIEPSDSICRQCSFQLPNGRFFGKLTEWPCPTMEAIETARQEG